jgi:PIN domain nuclease of toxin-antitoxin system
VLLSNDQKLRVPDEIELRALAWIRRALAPPLHLAAITPEVAVESTRLPEPCHRDPVDRLLTATARVEGSRS